MLKLGVSVANDAWKIRRDFKTGGRDLLIKGLLELSHLAKAIDKTRWDGYRHLVALQKLVEVFLSMYLVSQPCSKVAFSQCKEALPDAASHQDKGDARTSNWNRAFLSAEQRKCKAASHDSRETLSKQQVAYFLGLQCCSPQMRPTMFLWPCSFSDA